MEVSNEELLAFVAGEADGETKRRIAAEMKVEGSKVRRWLERLGHAASDPFNIEWGQLLYEEGIGEEKEDKKAPSG